MNDFEKPTTENLMDTGFCLEQALVWLNRCYQLGDVDYRDQHPEEAKRRDAAIANGVATLSAVVDMTGRTLNFQLNLDDGPNGAIEIPLMSQGFMPPELPN